MLLTKNKNFKEDSNMDKETLSNYGWIVICVLVLAVMLALATPFGKFISNAIENTTTALFQTSKAGLGSAGIDAGELVFGKQDGGAENPDTPDVPIVRSGIIPDGATYTPNGGTAIIGNGTNTFPNTPQTGDTYEEGDYKYTYNKGSYYGTEWSVVVKENTKTEYGEILSEIAGKPVTNMTSTFEGCESLTAAPTIPSSVTNMKSTFVNCTSLTTAPTIPSSVINMDGTFNGCTSLTTAPAIPNSVTSMEGTFSNCTSLTTAPTIPNSVTNMEYTFTCCTSLTTAPTIPSSVTNVESTFSGCSSLKTYVGSTDTDGDFSNYTIPNSVTNMDSTFSGCTNLTTAPTIPSSVKYMGHTFEGCTSLTGTIEINANPRSYYNCFASTREPITLRGSSPILAELADTSYGDNVTVG